ncbi:DUF559 domain-containing protein [Sphingomonas xinjiangensis]
MGGRGRALARAREMRKHPTEAERKLWRLLRNHRLAHTKWKRQQPIGRYIADFACLKHHLIVEANGAQHIASAYDAARDAWLQGQGFRLLRFHNNAILAEPDSVLTAILAAIEAQAGASSPALRSPSPRPSPARGEGEEGSFSG